MTLSAEPPQESSPTLPTAPPWPSFTQALAFWLKLGFISFGGPAAQIAIMHAELVERRRWISEQRFLHALNYCMVLPGPEAQQLATYLGWLMHRSWGGVAAGALFVLPSLAILITLSWVYLRFGEHTWLAGLFYGLKPAVVALVLHAALRLGSKTLHHPLLWGIAGAAFLAITLLDAPFPAILAVAALVGAWGARHAPDVFSFQGAAAAHAKAGRQPAPAVIDDHTPVPAHARFTRRRLMQVLAVGLALWALPMAALWLLVGWQATLTQMGWFFTKAALLTFGGAYAVLPYVYQGAVEHYQWLSTAQMIDGLALGETTPGPLIMVVAFVGFLGGWQQAVFGPEQLLAAGIVAAVVVTWFTFLPSFIFILAGGPLVEATRGQLALTAPLKGISAAVVGVIANLALFFAWHVFWPNGAQGSVDTVSVLMAVAAGVALIRFKLGVLPVLLAAAVIGLAVSQGLLPGVAGVPGLAGR